MNRHCNSFRGQGERVRASEAQAHRGGLCVVGGPDRHDRARGRVGAGDRDLALELGWDGGSRAAISICQRASRAKLYVGCYEPFVADCGVV